MLHACAWVVVVYYSALAFVHIRYEPVARHVLYSDPYVSVIIKGAKKTRSSHKGYKISTVKKVSDDYRVATRLIVWKVTNSAKIRW